MRHGMLLPIAAALAILAAPAAGQGMMQQIVTHECEKANADRLPFGCALRGADGGPWLFLTFADARPLPADARHRMNLLVRSYYQAGGKHVRLVDRAGKRQRSCGPAPNGTFGLYCSEPYPAD